WSSDVCSSDLLSLAGTGGPIPSSRSVGGLAGRGTHASPRSTTAISIASGAEPLTRVLIDTSAFYALEDASDRHHREARAIQRWYLRHRPRLFTTHHVLRSEERRVGKECRSRSAGYG